MPQPTEPNFGVGIERVSRVPSTIEPKDSKEKDIITFLNEISTEIENLSIDLSDLNDRGKRVKLLSTYISWLRHLSSLTEEILKNVSPEQSEIKTLNSDIKKLLLFLNSMLSQSLKFQTTRDDWFRPSPKDLATANRLDPDGKCIDLEAVAELYWPNFWLGIKSQIEKIAKRLIEIIEEKSDKELQKELEEFNRELKEINEAADREILEGIVDYLFRNTIRYTVYFGVGGAETKRLTIMELVSIPQILEEVKGVRDLDFNLRDFINHIPVSRSINQKNMQEYVKLFERLNKLKGLKGKKVKIVLRDTSKLSYLEALLKKINEQEQGILKILNRKFASFKNKGYKLNIDDFINHFKNALLFLIEILEKGKTIIKDSEDENSEDENSEDEKVKVGFVSFKTKEMKRRIKTSGELTYPDTTSIMVVKEAQGGNSNVCEFTSCPQYMLSLFDIGEILLVGE